MTITPQAPVADSSRDAAARAGERWTEELYAWYRSGEDAHWERFLDTSAPEGFVDPDRGALVEVAGGDGLGWVDENPGVPGVAAEVAGIRARLARLEVGSLGPAELVEVIGAVEALRSGVAAVQARATVAFETAMVSEGVARGFTARGARRGIAPQVALARRVSPWAGERWLAFSERLSDLPGTFAALEAGVCSEEQAMVISTETATTLPGVRDVVDAEMTPVLGTSGTRSLTEQTRTLIDTLDPAAAAARCTAAVENRRVVTRAGRDGMGSITIHAPLPQVAAAAEALATHTTKVCTGRASEPAGDGSEGPGDGEGEVRTWAQVQADTAITWLSGSLPTAPPPVTINLVMTPTQLLGTDATPVRIPGHGLIPATLARDLITPTEVTPTPSPTPEHHRDERDPARGDRSGHAQTAPTWEELLAPLLTGPEPGFEPPADAAVFLRRVFTTPDGRDLAAMESQARCFPPHLRQFLILRDDRDRHPFSDAPIRHADHIHPHSQDGPTSVTNGQGLSVRANHIKALPGWKARTLTQAEITAYTAGPPQDLNTRIARLAGPHTHIVQTTTPTGLTYLSAAPPLTG